MVMSVLMALVPTMARWLAAVGLARIDPVAWTARIVGVVGLVALLAAAGLVWRGAAWWTSDTATVQAGAQCREACDKAHLEARVRDLEASLRTKDDIEAARDAAITALTDDLGAAREAAERARHASPDPNAIVFPADDPWLVRDRRGVR